LQLLGAKAGFESVAPELGHGRFPFRVSLAVSGEPMLYRLAPENQMANPRRACR